MTCNVTGTAISPNGLIKPGARISFRRAQLDVVSQEGSFVIPDDYIIQTASDGTVDFDILPGVYDATTVAAGGRTVAFRVSVPDEPAADFADLLNASYVEIPPASVTQAQQARDAAIAARDAAQAAETAAELARDEAEAAADVSASAAALVGRKNPPMSGAKEFLEANAPLSAMSGPIVIEKLRTDYHEYAVYNRLTTDGIEWTRWYFTNRLGNSDNTGAPRLLLCHRAYLYASTTIATPSENYTSGTEGQAATTTQDVTGGTATGTWTTAATVSGVANVRYSTTVGDKYVHTITGVSRISWETVNVASNGGFAKITIKQAGSEIAAGYDVPLTSGERRVVLNSSSLTAGRVIVPLAGYKTALNPALTYEVTIEVSTANPASGRVYHCAIRGYAALAYNSTGIHGTAQSKTVSSSTGNLLFFSGQTIVHQITNATRIDWRYIATTGSSTAEFKVFNNAGAEIASYTRTSIATAAAQGAYTTTVAKDLTKGTYFLHVRVSSSVTGTDQRIYDMGAMGYDQTTAGDPSTDGFDLDGQAQVLGAFTTWGQSNFMGYGNQEYAVQFRKTTESAAAVTGDYFVTGVHNNENNPASITVTVDGSAVSWAAAAQYAKFVSTTGSISVSFTHEILFKVDQSKIGDLTWTQSFSGAGYFYDINTVLTSDAYIHIPYHLMMVNPNADTSVPLSSAGQLGANVGGGFDNGAMDGFGRIVSSSYNGSSTPIDVRCMTHVRLNGQYAVMAHVTNAAEIDRTFSAYTAGYLGTFSSHNDRTDGTCKTYTRMFMGPDANGYLLNSGFSFRKRGYYRVFKGDYRAAI